MSERTEFLQSWINLPTAECSKSPLYVNDRYYTDIYLDPCENNAMEVIEIILQEQFQGCFIKSLEITFDRNGTREIAASVIFSPN